MPKVNFVEVDKARFFEAIRMYFLWKELDTSIRSVCTRGINIPEAITEAIVCYATGFLLNKSSGGDACDNEKDRIIEIKACSNFDKDTTSFSPKEKFDGLYFARLDKREDIFYLYDLNLDSEKLEKIKVSKKQTLKEQQTQGRRPRFSVIKQIIEDNNISAFAKVDMRLKKVTKL